MLGVLLLRGEGKGEKKIEGEGTMRRKRRERKVG